MELDKGSPALQRLLDMFENLSEHDKAEALRHIAPSQCDIALPSATKTIELSANTVPALVDPISEVHSCHSCRQLRLYKSSDDSIARFSRWYESKSICLKRDSILQGLSRRCLLVQWILDYIGDSLVTFKTDLEEKGLVRSIKSPLDQAHAHTDDLQYISTEGILAQLVVRRPPGDHKMTLILLYSANQYLLDKLWDTKADHHNTPWGLATYEDFSNRYKITQNIHVKVSTTAADPAATEFPISAAVASANPEIDYGSALMWLNQCRNDHTNCVKKLGTLPTRVIDVGTRFPIRTVKLYWTEEGEEGHYISLSYCWGGPQPVMATQSTAQDITNGLAFYKLPNTLQDAMIVAYKVGIRYLWVDCLCIIQDDPADVTREIARMSQIYQNAVFTISAASAASVHEGFLGRRNTSHKPSFKLPIEVPGKLGGSVFVEREQTASDLAVDPINIRAWTLQEHILATRLLVFGSKELWWTCATVTRNLNGFQPSNQFAALGSKSNLNRFSLDSWRSIVRDYSRRFLTYPNDKLPALAGCAALYSQVYSGRYLAGLWEFALLSELMWSSNCPDISRPHIQRAPSWSWASVDGEIDHSWCPINLGENAPQIIKCHVPPISPASPYGSVDSNEAMLQIAGELACVYWHADRKVISWMPDSPQSTCVGQTQADPRDNETFAGEHAAVWVFPIVRNPIRGLLLAHVEGDRYRRVGLVTRLWNEEPMRDRFEAKTITLL